jgi:hypothetical protein
LSAKTAVIATRARNGIRSVYPVAARQSTTFRMDSSPRKSAAL